MSNHTHDDHDDEHSYQERVEKLSTMTVGVVKEIVPSGQITLLMHQIVNGNEAPPEIKAYVQVLLRIIQGERDANLAAHLPSDLARAVEDTIAQIEAPLPNASEEAGLERGLTLVELLEKVGEACLGNVGLWQQLWNFTETLEEDDATPEDIKVLAVVLRKILAGERQAHVLEGLPPEHSQPIALLLNDLVQRSAAP